MRKVSVSCNTFGEVSWLAWPSCPYTDHVAVFRFELLSDSATFPYLISLLQPDEILRSERFHKQADRQRFIYSRAILRILSAMYTGQSPNQVRFITGTNKKPVLVNTDGWCVNVSHAGTWILIAVGREEVGVDVEKLNPDFSFHELLPGSFSQEEQNYIGKAAGAGNRFYQLWTRKEALVKATGKGIDEDFIQIPSLTGKHTIESGLLGKTGDWTVNSLSVTSEYIAAVACQQTEFIPKFYTLDSVLFGYSESKWES